MNGADQTDRKKETRTGKRAKKGVGGTRIERSTYRSDERMRGSGTRNCTALEKIAFPLIISSQG